MINKLYTAAIDHEHGVNSYVSLTESDLKDQIKDYVSEWWADEIEDEDMPKDRDIAISLYFEAIAGRESYEIAEVDISDKLEPILQEASEKIMSAFWAKADSYLQAIKSGNPSAVAAVGRMFRDDVDSALGLTK